MLGTDPFALATGNTVSGTSVTLCHHIILCITDCPAFLLHILPHDLIVEGEVFWNGNMHGAAFRTIGAAGAGDSNLRIDDVGSLMAKIQFFVGKRLELLHTVMENIRLGKHGASDEEVLAAAGAANCDEFVEKLPQGYATPIGENGAKLSGGERQRISIARALLKNAPIVLLDEATASLDVENETKVQGALSRLLSGKTVLVIAHRMRTVEAADKIVVLTDGMVAEEGSPAELFAKENSLFRRMTQLQNASAGWSI